MVTPTDGAGTANTTLGDGAAAGQPSNTEVTELRAQIAALTTTATEHETAMAASIASVTELQAANKKFADDAVGLATQGQQLKDAQQALEESRKTSTDLTTQLEQAKTSHAGLQEQVIARRRQDLITRYSLPEERVANLDEAGLTVLESTLPHVPAAQATTTPARTANGHGISGGGTATDLSAMSDSDRALLTIERLKENK